MAVGASPAVPRPAATHLLVSGVLLMATAILALPGRAAAGDLSSRQNQLHSQQVQLQQELASARASDAQVQQAVGRLDQIATTQGAAATVAQRKLADAQAQVDQLDQEVATLNGQLEQSKTQVLSKQNTLRQQAITAYTNGTADAGIDTLFASNAENASVIAEYRSVVAGSINDTIDRLHQAQSVLDARRVELQSALSQAHGAVAEASARARSAAAAASAAQQAATAQVSAHGILSKRISDFNSESTDLAAQQQQIAALLAQSVSATRGTRSGTHSVGLVWPLRGSVTSEFGPRWGGFHPGIDISNPTGTPIHAAKAGQVVYAGWESGYGNFVLIAHGAGVATGYAHQSQIAVSQGQTVAQGEVIGYVGSTGDSTGPHLHFEVRVDGSPQNPRSYVPGSP